MQTSVGALGRLRASTVVAGAAVALTAACSGEPAAPGVQEEFQRRNAGLELLVSGLDLAADVAIEPAGNRMLVLEREGQIRLVDGGELLPDPVLDITPQVYSAGVIAGLMQIVLAPDYATSGRFYISYVSLDGNLRIDRHVLAPNGTAVDPAASSSVLSIPLPSNGAVGGALAFGPDAMLYVGIGDGGTPQSAESAQDLRTLLGSVLRLDVSGAGGYSVPPDNPYVGHATARPEIWAHGVHDPRSISFDVVGAVVLLLESGAAWQEVNVQPIALGGLDYGWPALDGSHCFRPETGCNREGRVEPTLEYGPNALLIPVQGEVYRGSEITGLYGHFIWADFWAGWVRSFRVSQGEPSERTEWILPVRPARWTGFSATPSGELIVFGGPNIHRLIPDAR